MVYECKILKVEVQQPCNIRKGRFYACSASIRCNAPRVPLPEGRSHGGYRLYPDYESRMLNSIVSFVCSIGILVQERERENAGEIADSLPTSHLNTSKHICQRDPSGFKRTNSLRTPSGLIREILLRVQNLKSRGAATLECS